MSSSRLTLPEKLAAAWPPERWQDVTVLVAVSGGADSVALLRGLAQIRRAGEGRLIVAHFNHRLRGAESDGDEAFVGELARKLGLEVVVGGREEEGETERRRDRETGALASEDSLRELRHSFLASVAGARGARYVATAHTADDQVETILHNILRGTGLAGLAGIPKLRRLTDATTLVRPMLQITRAEVLDYLKVLQQPFREDSTNQLIAYTRNRIRQQLLPLLERDFNPRVREALLRLGHIATETDEYLTQQATALLPTISRPTPTGVEIDVQQLQSAHPARVRHVMMLVWEQEDWPLQDMSFEKWETLRLMLENDSERAMQTLPGGISVERRGNVLQLTRPS